MQYDFSLQEAVDVMLHGEGWMWCNNFNKNTIFIIRQNKIIYNAIDEIENDTKTKFSIIFDFTFDMLTSECELKSPEYNLDKMGYEVVQYIIQQNESKISRKGVGKNESTNTWEFSKQIETR